MKAMKITFFWLNTFLEQAGCGSLESAKKSCIATLSLTDESGFLIAPINYVYPDALKNVDIPVANVTVSKSLVLRLTCRKCNYCEKNIGHFFSFLDKNQRKLLTWKAF